jgi:hypothetical protein
MQTAFDEEYVLEKKRKKAEYDRQYRLKQKPVKEQRASNATLNGDGSDSEYIFLNVPNLCTTYDEADAEFKRRWSIFRMTL